MRPASLALMLAGVCCSSVAPLAAPDGEGSAAEARRALAPEGFWEVWGDGRAELAGYRLVQPRYGELRTGEAVLVYVTETFTHGQRVKSDGGHPDEYPVLKLNLARHFQTGIYDYDVMSSTFVRLDGEAPLGVPVKVSLGVQEWCGNVYEQLVSHPERLAWTSHSYFDGEADRQRDLPLPDGEPVLADALPILVRGLAGELVAPGARRSLRLLPTLLEGRLAHRAPDWLPATISRSGAPAPVTVPAGTFDAWTYRVETASGWTEYQVEAAAPHRLLAWSGSDGERAELLGTSREAYWNQHGEGDEALRARLGLPVPAEGSR